MYLIRLFYIIENKIIIFGICPALHIPPKRHPSNHSQSYLYCYLFSHSLPLLTQTIEAPQAVSEEIIASESTTDVIMEQVQQQQAPVHIQQQLQQHQQQQQHIQPHQQPTMLTDKYPIVTIPVPVPVTRQLSIHGTSNSSLASKHLDSGANRNDEAKPPFSYAQLIVQVSHPDSLANL